MTQKELEELIGKCLEYPKNLKYGDLAFNIRKFIKLWKSSQK